MDPIDVGNIHKVLIAYGNIYFGGDNTKMWNHLKMYVSCSKQTFLNIMYHCQNSQSVWLEQLINAILLPLDFWLDNKLAKQLFDESRDDNTKEKCKLYFVKKKEWKQVNLQEISLLEKIHFSCSCVIEETASAMHKDSKILSYCIKNKKLPPGSKCLFSIGQYIGWFNSLQLNWKVIIDGYVLPPNPNRFANENIDRSFEGSGFSFYIDNHRRTYFKKDEFFKGIWNTIEELEGQEGGLTELNFMKTMESFVKRMM